METSQNYQKQMTEYRNTALKFSRQNKKLEEAAGSKNLAERTKLAEQLDRANIQLKEQATKINVSYWMSLIISVVNNYYVGLCSSYSSLISTNSGIGKILQKCTMYVHILHGSCMYIMPICILYMVHAYCTV